MLRPPLQSKKEIRQDFSKDEADHPDIDLLRGIVTHVRYAFKDLLLQLAA